mmetsp:Transcript_23942/g.78249  ORF Transcript_23942/g.78249 Transcript_23942/m.78249 type:complete len:473 (+) Transcript_23942:198-1616(+)
MNSVSGAWRKGYGGRERESAQEQLTTVHVAQRLAPQASHTQCPVHFASPPLGHGRGDDAALPIRLGAPRPHRHKLLRGRRVDGAGVVKVRLGGAHLDGHGKALQHLVRRDADHVEADDALLLAGADELHRHRLLGLLLAQRKVHRLEDRLVRLDVRVAVRLARLRLGQPDRPDRRVRKHHRRDVCILELCVGRAAKDAVGEAAAGGNRDGRQLEAGGGGVAEAVEAGDARLLLLVHDHSPLAVQLDAGRLEPELGRDRRPPDRHQDAVERREPLAARQPGRQLARSGVLLDGDHLRVGEELRARARDLGVDDLLHERVEAVAQHTRAPDGEGDGGAQRLQDARELDGDVARADDERLLRLRLEVEEPVARDAVFRARDGRRRRPSSDRDQDVVGRVAGACDLDLARRDEARKALDVGHAGVVEVPRVDAVEARDVRIALGREGAPIEPWLAHLHAVPGRGLCRLKVRRRRVH